VNDCYRGTLSSYAYVLLCIYSLQNRSPPVLPALQSLRPHTFSLPHPTWPAAFFDDIAALRDFSAANGESLAELLVAFFDYWHRQHDWRSSVVSVRTGGLLHKGEKAWDRRVGSERHLMCIEDPFDLSHDLGRTMDSQTSGVLKQELSRAARALLREPDAAVVMDSLFSRYTSPPAPPAK